MTSSLLRSTNFTLFLYILKFSGTFPYEWTSQPSQISSCQTKRKKHFLKSPVYPLILVVVVSIVSIYFYVSILNLLHQDVSRLLTFYVAFVLTRTLQLFETFTLLVFCIINGKKLKDIMENAIEIYDYCGYKEKSIFRNHFALSIMAIMISLTAIPGIMTIKELTFSITILNDVFERGFKMQYQIMFYLMFNNLLSLSAEAMHTTFRSFLKRGKEEPALLSEEMPILMKRLNMIERFVSQIKQSLNVIILFSLLPSIIAIILSIFYISMWNSITNLSRMNIISYCVLSAVKLIIMLELPTKLSNEVCPEYIHTI